MTACTAPTGRSRCSAGAATTRSTTCSSPPADRRGYRPNDDFNGPDQEGVGRYDFTIHNGRRASAAACYLRPALKRPNLTVETAALT